MNVLLPLLFRHVVRRLVFGIKTVHYIMLMLFRYTRYSHDTMGR